MSVPKIQPMTKADVIAAGTGSDKFIAWLKFILDWECTVNHAGVIQPEDDGDGAGITFAGLTERDDAFPEDGITPEWVFTTYQNGYWAKAHGEDLPAPLGAVVANFAVNCGIVTAFRMLQLALCDYGQQITCDGIYGQQTFNAVMQIPNASELAQAVISKADSRYKRIAAGNPSVYGKDLAGWLNRNNALRMAFTS